MSIKRERLSDDKIERFKEIEKLCRENMRLPKKTQGELLDCFWLKENSDTVEVKKLKRMFDAKTMDSFLEKSKAVFEWMKKTGYKPRTTEVSEAAWYQFLRYNKEKIEYFFGMPEYPTYFEKEKKEEVKDFRKFCERKGRLPRQFESDEEKYFTFMNYNRRRADVQEILERFRHCGLEQEFNKKVEELLSFIEVEGRLPSATEKSEKALYEFKQRHLESLELSHDISKNKTKLDLFREKINNGEIEITRRRCVRFESREQELVEFLAKNNRLPSASVKEERGLYGFQNKHRDYLEDLYSLSQYKKLVDIQREERLSFFIDFIEKEDRLPHSKKEKALFEWFVKNIKKHKEVKAAAEKYGYVKDFRRVKQFAFEKNLEKLEAHLIKNGKLPSTLENQALAYFVKNHLETKEVSELVSKYNANSHKKSKFLNRCKELELFIQSKQRMPRIREKSEAPLYNWYSRNKNEMEVLEIIELYFE